MASHAVGDKSSFATVGTSLTWLVDHPVMLGLFLVAGIVNTVAQGSVALQVVAYVIGLFAGGFAHVSVESLTGEGTLDYGTAAERVLRRMLVLVGIAIVVTLVTALGAFLLGIVGGVLLGPVGAILFFVPMIYVAVRLSLAFPACVVDGTGVAESISRGWKASSGKVAKLFVIFFLVFGTQIALVIALLGRDELLAMAESGTVPTEYVLPIGAVAAVLTGIMQLSIGRVYLEERGSSDGRN